MGVEEERGERKMHAWDDDEASVVSSKHRHGGCTSLWVLKPYCFRLKKRCFGANTTYRVGYSYCTEFPGYRCFTLQGTPRREDPHTAFPVTDASLTHSTHEANGDKTKDSIYSIFYCAPPLVCRCNYCCTTGYVCVYHICIHPLLYAIRLI